MNRTLLWRDLRALSKDLCEILSTDHGNKAASLSYCLDVVGSINKRFDQPAVAPVPFSPGNYKQTPAFVLGVDAPAQSLLLGTTKPKGFFAKGLFKKKTPVYLTPQAALNQVMLIGGTGSGRPETLVTLLVNAALDKKGVFYLDGKGDSALYARTVANLSDIGLVGDLRVINLLGASSNDLSGKKMGHTLDLFQGMDWQALSEWMQQVAPLPKQKDDQKLSRDLLSELCPQVSRLLFYWSIHTGKKITPSLVSMALTYEGMRELHAALSEEDKMQHQPLLKATHDPQGLECVALSVLVTHLRALTVSWGHVFESDKPEVGLLDSIKAKHFVLVLCPSMERPPAATKAATAAIAASMYQAMKALPVSGLFDHLVIFDDAATCMTDQTLCDLSGLRNRGCGLVWGGGVVPDQKLRLRLASLEGATWHPPATCIAMKQATASQDTADYYQWCASQQSAPSLSFLALENLNDLLPGDAVVCSAAEHHSIVMDCKQAKRQEKLFIPHANPLPHEELALPGPMKRPSRASSHRDKDKQAIVLFDRLSEFDERNLGRGYPPKLSWCQETLARMMGFAHWHEAQIRCAPADE